MRTADQIGEFVIGALAIKRIAVLENGSVRTQVFARVGDGEDTDAKFLGAVTFSSTEWASACAAVDMRERVLECIRNFNAIAMRAPSTIQTAIFSVVTQLRLGLEHLGV